MYNNKDIKTIYKTLFKHTLITKLHYYNYQVLNVIKKIPLNFQKYFLQKTFKAAAHLKAKQNV